MNLSNEMLKKAKAAQNAAELLALAKENSIEITEDEANSYFAELHRSGELADEELDNVVGAGVCDADPDYSSGDTPLYHEGQCVDYRVSIGGGEGWRYYNYVQVIAVHHEKSGPFHPEFTYDIQHRDGSIVTDVYESQITRTW